MQFSKVVLWGHKLHSNTFSYVHHGFQNAFKHMGYEVLWLDDSDDVSGISFSNALFFTEGQVDGKIPIDPSCKYVLHNCSSQKYPNRLNIQIYRQSCPEHNWAQYEAETEAVSRYVFYSRRHNTLFQPWATDLLPHEIDVDDAKRPRERVCHWVGTIGGYLYGNENEIAPFRRACEENGVEFVHHWPTSTSMDVSRDLIKKSIIAPAIHGTWQQKNGYAACRIFKNISYGHLGVTNCPAVQHVFEDQLVFNRNEYQLFFDAMPEVSNTARIIAMMEVVRRDHTYINRAKMILSVL